MQGFVVVGVGGVSALTRIPTKNCRKLYYSFCCCNKNGRTFRPATKFLDLKLLLKLFRHPQAIERGAAWFAESVNALQHITAITHSLHALHGVPKCFHEFGFLIDLICIADRISHHRRAEKVGKIFQHDI